jgi:hypothetical protein
MLEYIIENDEYYFTFPDGNMFIGETIGFLFDIDTGSVLKHGDVKLVRTCMVEMIRTLSQASQEMPKEIPEEIFKEVCDMKEALTLVEINIHDDINLDTINSFVNNTGHLKQWYEKVFL